MVQLAGQHQTRRNELIMNSCLTSRWGGDIVLTDRGFLVREKLATEDAGLLVPVLTRVKKSEVQKRLRRLKQF